MDAWRRARNDCICDCRVTDFAVVACLKCERSHAIRTKGNAMTAKPSRRVSKTTAAPKLKLSEAERKRLIAILEQHLSRNQQRRARKSA